MRMMRTRQPTQQPSTLTSSMVSWRVHKLALWAFLLVLAVHCPRTATAQDTPSAGATPTSTPPGAVPPANTTDQEIQLMPTLPLQTTTANLTRDQASSASSNQQQQQQQPAASPIQTGSSGGDAGGVVPDPEASKTDTAVQQAQQQVQGPIDTTDAATAGAMPLIHFPGCTNRGGSPFFSPGISHCEVQGLLSRHEADMFSFTMAPATDSSRPYRVLIMLRTVDGDAQLGLSIPQNNVTDPIPDQVGTQIYGTEITSEVIIEVPWGVLSQNPGTYIISTTQPHKRVLYTLRVLTPFDDVVLAEPDLSAIKDLHKACCDDSNATSSFCTEYLPAAIAPQHSADDDLCRITPMMCDENGHLTQLAIAQAGLICPAGLPDSFGQLEFLETIDLAFNDINMDVKDMGKIIAQLPALESAFMRYTGLTGSLGDDCALIKSLNLTRMSISGNNITGSLPDCYLKDETLEELYLSQTGLRGSLPDVVPPGSPLRLLYAINYIQPDRVGFTGALPASLFASASLTYLDLGNHKFSGGVPAMNNNMRLLNLSMNALDGQIEGTFPTSLETLDLAYNQLQGSLPAGIDQLANLTMFNIPSNRFSGQLPQVLPDNLLVFDVSENQFTGSPPPMLPEALHFFNAANNSLSGTLPAVPTPSYLVTYQLFDNALTGTLPISLINGSAPALLFIDVSSNQLSGRLDGSSGSSSAAGRKMLQDASAGAAWDTTQLAYVDFSNNTFTGPIPASLANLTNMVYMDVSSNQLSGSLQPFADTLTTGTSDEDRPDLLVLNVSNNQLSGPIPDSLQYAPMMDPSRVGTVARRGQLPPRVLDLSGNSFSGPFPTWLPTQSALVARACGQLCSVDVDVNGTNMKLSCPNDLATTPDQTAFLKRQNFQCTDNSGQQVSLLTAVNPGNTGGPSTSDTSASRQEGKSRTANAAELNNLDDPMYAGDPNVALQQQQQKGGGNHLSPGALAGIVIAAVAGAAIIAGGVFFGAKKLKHRRAGWRKDDFGHDLPPTDPFGIARGPTLHTNGSGAANGVGAGIGSIGSMGGVRSVRFQDSVHAASADNAFKAAGSTEYPHTPYEKAQAGIEMLNSRKGQL